MSKHVAAVNQSSKGEGMMRKAVFCAAAVLACAFFAGPALASGDDERGEYREREHSERHEERGEERGERAEFYGTVEALPQSGLNGTWRVSGRDVVVTERTRIEEKYGKVAVGAQVEVKGGGTPFTATKIEVKTGDRR